MNVPPDRLFGALDGTWPAARRFRSGPWMLREGRGGGKRVSAATALDSTDDHDVTAAETEMRTLGQTPLFMIRPGDDPLDQLLERKGYAVVDPVSMLTCRVDALTQQPVPRLTTFVIWEPLAIMEEIWAQGGIGRGRIDVMRRASVKTGILARNGQRPAGTAFAAIHDDIAIVHAVEVLPEHRRAGLAGWIMRQAAFWAKEQGVGQMAVLCTKANTAALALYSGLGFEPAAQYHYRQHPKSGDLRDG